ncbi:MAG: hypothetical protein ACKVX7_17035 [Planctomycetota bacterium]
MPYPLQLRCRCGWEHEFQAPQAGQQFSCPRCERGLLVTEDPAEFLNANVGGQDFQFSEDPAAPAESTGAIGIYRKQTARRRARGAATAITPHGRGRTGSHGAASPKAKSLGPILIWLGLGVIVVLGLAFMTYAGRTARVDAVDAFAARVAAGLNKLNGLQPAEAYASAELLRRLVLELQERSAATGDTRFERHALRVPQGYFSGPDDCTLVLRGIAINKDGRRIGTEVALHSSYTKNGWRVDHYKIEALSAVQLSGVQP